MTDTEIEVPAVRVQMDKGTVTMICEPTDDPLLVITPGLASGEFSGTFVLTHVPTGLRVGRGACINCVREAVRNLGELDLDWDVPAGRSPEAPKGALVKALEPMITCVDGHGLGTPCAGCGVPRTREFDDEFGGIELCLNPDCTYDK